jgi:hypothetical protein
MDGFKRLKLHQKETVNVVTASYTVLVSDGQMGFPNQESWCLICHISPDNLPAFFSEEVSLLLLLALQSVCPDLENHLIPGGRRHKLRNPNPHHYLNINWEKYGFFRGKGLHVHVHVCVCMYVCIYIYIYIYILYFGGLNLGLHTCCRCSTI